MHRGNAVDVVGFIGIVGGHDSLDPNYAYVEDMPRSAAWPSMVHHSTDFSNSSNKLKRAFNIINTIVLMLTYLHASKLSA